MHSYRLYVFNAAKSVLDFHEFTAPGDGEALDLVQSCGRDLQMELWNERRKVRCWGFPGCSRCN